MPQSWSMYETVFKGYKTVGQPSMIQSNPHQRQSSYNWLILFISGSVPFKIHLGEEEGLACLN